MSQQTLASTTRLFLDGVIDASELPAPTWGPIGEEVYNRTYRRDDETWAASVRRIVLGNISYAPQAVESGEAEALFDLLYDFKPIPAGRHLWVTGTQASHFNRNCWVAGWSRRLSNHFAFGAARLFEGGGVGGNYSYDLRSVTEPVRNHVDLFFTIKSDHPNYDAVKGSCGDRFVEWNEYINPQYVVEDQREGWIDLWTTLIDIACDRDGNHQFLVDLSQLRPYGAELKTFGGRASGPEPLASSSLGIIDVLNSVKPGEQLTGLQAMWIDHYIAASVVAGGARRSARMSLMHWRDPEIFEFINCKSDHVAHWSTNISIEIDSAFREALDDNDPHAMAVFRAMVTGMALNGEPGFVDTELHSVGERTRIRLVNPCGEASLEAEFDPEGDAAGESCNLGSINLDRYGTDSDGIKRAIRLMARFLYRATEHKHADSKASRIEERNRRIGVGLLGVQGWAAAYRSKLSELPDSTVLVKLLEEFAEVARDAGNEIADQLGTPRPIKVTAIAPTGTIAQLAGSTPGIHPIFARHFIRRVRYSNSDPNLDVMKAAGYNVIPDIYADSTSVVEFPVRDALLDRFGEDVIEDTEQIGLDKFIRLMITIQNAYCGGSNGQAVSATASIPANMDVDELAECILPAIGSLKGLTVFPELSRPLSPYERISKAEWLELTRGGVMLESGDSNDGACVGGSCPIR